MASRKVLSLLAGVAALSLPTVATAQWENPLSFLSGDWTVTARGNVVASPKYPGSDEMSWVGFPSIKMRRVGQPDTFGAPDDPASMALFRPDRFRMGPSFRYIGSRSPSDDVELFGLNKVRRSSARSPNTGRPTISVAASICATASMAMKALSPISQSTGSCGLRNGRSRSARACAW
jgi:outer membrane scaffolding protein for murein synthesis (MipA/OmpV family)